MYLIHNGSVGQDSPTERQAETQTEAAVEVAEEVAGDSQEQQETQMIEVMAQS